MPRGGAREGAGKPSSWSSGCKYEDTKLIRVPKFIASKVLELAHSLDEGVDYEIVTNSLLEENERLKNNLECLQNSFDILHQATQNKITDNTELISKSKELLYDESLVRAKDRSPVKKLLSKLFGIDKSYYEK